MERRLHQPFFEDIQMKRLTVVLSSLILMIASFGSAKVQGGESWTIPLNPPSWSRDQDGFNVSVETFAATGKDSIHIVINLFCTLHIFFVCIKFVVIILYCVS